MSATTPAAGASRAEGASRRTVVRLAIAPVKSLALTARDAVRLEPPGAVGDRALFLVDRARHRLYNGISRGRLVQVGAELRASDGWLRLCFPDGAVVEGTTADLGERLVADVHARQVPARVVRGPFAAALSAFAAHEVELVRPDQPGAALDVHPLTLVSRASVDALAGAAGDPRLADGRRFRMLIEVAGCHAYEEDAWAGTVVRIGEALVRALAPVPRCGVTQQDPERGAFQLPTLRHLARQRGTGPDGLVFFGMYGEVVDPGWVRVGDAVVPGGRPW